MGSKSQLVPWNTTTTSAIATDWNAASPGPGSGFLPSMFQACHKPDCSRGFGSRLTKRWSMSRTTTRSLARTTTLAVIVWRRRPAQWSARRRHRARNRKRLHRGTLSSRPRRRHLPRSVFPRLKQSRDPEARIGSFAGTGRRALSRPGRIFGFCRNRPPRLWMRLLPAAQPPPSARRRTQSL